MSWISPELIEILLTILKAVVILLVVVTCGAFMSFGERRLLGLFQNRYGPNRVGWGGSLQLVADMIKMFFKEDWIPKFSDRVIFTLAPMIAFTSLLLAFAIVPVSPGWVVADLNIGILFFLMMAGLAVYAVLFAGWSSNNKYSLLGAMRASAQTLSYEVFLGLSLMGVVAQAAGVASFPFLASLAARGDMDEFRATLRRTMTNSMIVAVPVTAWMITASGPVLGFIFEGGSFSVAETRGAAPLLQIMMLAVPFWLLQQVTGRAFYAREDTVTPAVVGTVVTLLAVPGYMLLIPLLGARGVALVTTASIALYALVLMMVACRRWASGAFVGIWGTAWRSALISMPGCGIMLAVMHDGFRLMKGWNALLQQFIVLAVGGVLFVASWLVIAWFFHRDYFRLVTSPFLRRVKRVRQS